MAAKARAAITFAGVSALKADSKEVPSPPLPPFDKSNPSKIVGMYVLVPASLYPKWAAAGVIGWAARVEKFVCRNKVSKVMLKIEIDDKPVPFVVGGVGKYDLWNLIRLT